MNVKKKIMLGFFIGAVIGFAQWFLSDKGFDTNIEAFQYISLKMFITGCIGAVVSLIFLKK